MDLIEDNTLAGWVVSLARSKAAVETGDVVPMEPVLGRIRVAIARMKTRREAEGMSSRS